MMGAVESDHAAPEVLPAPVPAVPDVALAPVAPSVTRLLGLQRGAGNVAVTRMLQRQPATLVPGHEDYDTARKERDAFVAAGKKGPQTYNPSARNPDNYYGGFDVEYDPGSEALNISLKGGVLFLAGIVLDATGNATAVETSAQGHAPPRRSPRSTSSIRPIGRPLSTRGNGRARAAPTRTTRRTS